MLFSKWPKLNLQLFVAMHPSHSRPLKNASQTRQPIGSNKRMSLWMEASEEHPLVAEET